MEFTIQELRDLLQALETAAGELAFDPENPNRFPEAYSMWVRWTDLQVRVINELMKRGENV